MRLLTLALLGCCLLALGSVGGIAEPSDGPCPPAETVPTGGPQITAVAPNTVVPGNEGEYVLLEVPQNHSLGEYRLTDGHTTAALPNTSPTTPVAATRNPETTAELTDHPTVQLEGPLRLAADGDEIALERDNRTVDRIEYGRAPTAERWFRTGERPDEGAFWPREATCRAPVTATPEETTAFVLPDDPETPLTTLAAAEDRIRLGAYELTEPAVVDELVAAADRGVDVRVLLEATPVGGHPSGTAAAVERLQDAEVPVRAIGEGTSRYNFHHPKYAVADDRVLVTTENWKAAGVGGDSSRGWGVVMTDPALADALSAVFTADATGWDTTAADTLEDADDEPPPERDFPTRHEAESVAVDRVELVLAPDAAADRLESLIRSADEEILIKQPRIAGPDFELLAATLAAARDGVSVAILLDSSWYVREDNEALAATLEDLAERDSLDLSVRLADADGYEKVHAKGLVVDDTAVVGSLNWNDNSLHDNREVIAVLHGEEVAAYFRAVFEGDWAEDGWTVPLDAVGIVLVALTATAVIAARSLVFEEERTSG